MKRMRCGRTRGELRPGGCEELPKRREHDLDVVVDDSRPEGGIERAELPEVQPVAMKIAVMTARMAQRRQDRGSARQAAGAENEGTALADRCRHVPGGHDDAHCQAKENQPDQLASHRMVHVVGHGFAAIVPSPRLYGQVMLLPK